jgi:N-acyl-D-amino-acid deacylase
MYRAAAIIGFRERWGIDLAWPTYAAYFEDLAAVRPGVNIAAFAGHGAIRLAAMGTAQRLASASELERMEAMLHEAMDSGALGLSSGLEYSPGMYADEAELGRLCRVVGRHEGTYASHIRSRGDGFVAAVAEAISIAETGGVRLVLSHLAPRPYATPDDSARVRELIEAARARGLPVTIDTFPDEWGPSPLASLLPPWIIDGSRAAVSRRFGDPEIVQAARAAFDRADNYLLRGDGPANMRLTTSSHHPELIGQTLASIGAAWKSHLADVVCTLLNDEGLDFYSVLIQHRYATAADLDLMYRDPMCAFESDGVVTAPDGELSDMIMNRSTYGYTARVLGELVRERQILSIEEAIRRMTSLPAAAVGLDRRGMLRVGAAADMVIFDPTRILDRSTDIRPAATPTGIDSVIVNGRVAVAGSRLTGERAGRVVRLGAIGDLHADAYTQGSGGVGR